MKRAKFQAIQCIQNKRSFYLAVLTSDVLRKTCFVSRTEDDPLAGFQRHLNEGRARDIAHYLDERGGVIPSSLILSSQSAAEFDFDASGSQIGFNLAPKSFLVIDGQHRMYGLFESKRNYDVPVVVFRDLDLAAETGLFIDINTTQKGVPTSLLLAIKYLTGRESTVEERQRKLFESLNSGSPLAGYLSSTKSVPGRISRAAFNEATKPILEYGPLSDKSNEIVHQAISNYLAAFEIIFEKSRTGAHIKKTLFFKSIFAIFNEAATKCLNDTGNLRVESLTQLLDPLTKIEFDNYSGTSYQTQNKLVQEMRSELNRYDRVTENIF